VKTTYRHKLTLKD